MKLLISDRFVLDKKEMLNLNVIKKEDYDLKLTIT